MSPYVLTVLVLMYNISHKVVVTQWAMIGGLASPTGAECLCYMCVIHQHQANDSRTQVSVLTSADCGAANLKDSVFVLHCPLVQATATSASAQLVSSLSAALTALDSFWAAPRRSPSPPSPPPSPSPPLLGRRRHLIDETEGPGSGPGSAKGGGGVQSSLGWFTGTINALGSTMGFELLEGAGTESGTETRSEPLLSKSGQGVQPGEGSGVWGYDAYEEDNRAARRALRSLLAFSHSSSRLTHMLGVTATRPALLPPGSLIASRTSRSHGQGSDQINSMGRQLKQSATSGAPGTLSGLSLSAVASMQAVFLQVSDEAQGCPLPKGLLEKGEGQPCCPCYQSLMNTRSTEVQAWARDGSGGVESRMLVQLQQQMVFVCEPFV
jgi:hypothetical protein